MTHKIDTFPQWDSHFAFKQNYLMLPKGLLDVFTSLHSNIIKLRTSQPAQIYYIVDMV